MKRPSSSIDDETNPSSKFSKNPDNSRKLTFQLNDSVKDLETQPVESKFKTHQSTPYPKQKLSLKKKLNENEQNSNDVSEKRNPEYLTKITSLNRSFIRWIDVYFNKGYNYDFTPVCNDYIRFINNLKEKYPVETDLDKENSVQNQIVSLDIEKSPIKVPSYLSSPYMNTPPPNPGDKNYKSTPHPKLFLKDNKKKSEDTKVLKESKIKEKKQIDFSIPKKDKKSTSPASKSEPIKITKNLFETKKKDAKAIDTNLLDPTIRIQSSIFDEKIFSSKNIFDNQQINLNQNTVTSTNEDEEYVPPKPEVAMVNENAVYSVKCKLFYKKDNSYVEKGVGTLYIKETKEKNGNYQLLIRGDNSLATILLNIRLKISLPVIVTKNGILLTCIPNPPLETIKKNDNSETATFYIKVKTNEIRNDLCGKIKKYSS